MLDDMLGDSLGGVLVGEPDGLDSLNAPGNIRGGLDNIICILIGVIGFIIWLCGLEEGSKY